MLIRKEIADNMGILALQGHAVIPGLCFQDTLALRYNDIAPLENHHASASVMLGRTGSCFFQEVIALSSRIMGPLRPSLSPAYSCSVCQAAVRQHPADDCALLVGRQEPVAIRFQMHKVHKFALFTLGMMQATLQSSCF